MSRAIVSRAIVSRAIVSRAIVSRAIVSRFGSGWVTVGDAVRVEHRDQLKDETLAQPLRRVLVDVLVR